MRRILLDGSSRIMACSLSSLCTQISSTLAQSCDHFIFGVLKAPLRIKIFMWFVHKQVILTKDNLSKKGWKGAKHCEFCDSIEKVDHFFFLVPYLGSYGVFWGCSLGNQRFPVSFLDLCQNQLPNYTGEDRVVVMLGVAALLWSIWKTRNKSCFQSLLPRDPTNVIFTLCSTLDSWTVLHKKGVRC